MPRGFLVKRSKKPNVVSYRSRCEAEDRKPFGDAWREGAPASMRSRWPPPPPSALVAAPEREIKGIRFGIPEGAYRALRSPTRPTSGEREAERQPTLGLGSPVSAEAFPTAAAALTALGHLFDMGSNTAAPKRATESERKVKSGAKRAKNIRKLHLQDHVTISPVLGLKIRAVPAAERRSPAVGDFVCQLCGEAYADPLGLAQHRCSRIVRVEYRCPECDKVFSCPANLASHRRWHKPKAEQRVRPEHGRAHPGPPESGSEGEEPHECAQCAKKFKRHACLRKHVAARHAAVDLSGAAGAQACPKCGEVFAGAEARQRHLRPPHDLCCKTCPDVLRSSPALTRHLTSTGDQFACPMIGRRPVQLQLQPQAH
ncbi:insulinoma-associated protein 1a-like [Syngnathus acus]|uniref:insulinoma-associated protein 1a-like n=1 Tax=Syngnathus acus TaxID=161584 RepID=UPI001885B4F7|nr:insulinoma-associated protein 1a-like [Syngnathus acus]